MKNNDTKTNPVLDGFREGFTCFLNFTRPYEPEPAPYNNSVEEAWREVGEILRQTMYGQFHEEKVEKPKER